MGTQNLTPKGWLTLLALACCLKVSYSAHSKGISVGPSHTDELTFYVVTPMKPIDWTTVSGLADSIAEGDKRNDPYLLGHVFVSLKCGGRERIMTSMTSRDNSELKQKLLEDEIGLGMMFHSFEGMLQTTDRAHQKVMDLWKPRTRNIGIMKLLINAQACERLELFVNEFKRCGYERNYGLLLSPLNREGSGCAAFAVGFIEAAGLMNPDWHRRWTRSLRAPERLIGGAETGRRVSFENIVKGNYGLMNALGHPREFWANPNEPHREISFWDAELWLDWIRLNANVHQFDSRPVVILDKRNVAAPSGAIFKKSDSCGSL